MKSNKTALLLLIFALVTGCGGGGSSPSAPSLVSIAVTPTSPSIALGIAEQFTAMGTFADGSKQNVTTLVTWSSTNTAVATISNTSALNGLATSKGTGSTTITAMSGNVSNTATLTVVSKALVSIAVAPATWNMPTNTTVQYTATGTYSDNSILDLTTSVSVTWTSTIPAVAIISNATGSQGLATSVAPGTTLIAARSGNAPGSGLLSVTGTSTANNVLPITVNGTLCSAATSAGYLNKPCVSVTVCTPGSVKSCNTINDILLDTGSFGLRIFKQVLTATLTQVNAGSGSLAECIQFGDGSSDWGPVKLADVTLGNETASNVPIQVIDSTFGTRSTGCQNADTGPTSAGAGFNGLLGVGLFAQDCGSICASSLNNGMYYSCRGSVCAGSTASLAKQVTNPVAKLPTDNNGVIVELPSVRSSGTPSVNGILVLGIDTQPNNASSGVIKYSTDGFGDFVTILNDVSYPSFIDSGSNGMFFTTPSTGLLPNCTLNPGWFCPSSVTTLSATNADASLPPVSSNILFQIGNFDNLASSSTNNVFSNIGAAAPGLFDWGLPFYLGRSVYVGIDGMSSNLGPGPYFAY
jgi:Protein of unknown function (DUF3443)/Bacterial Ig-like domain (group 2)